MKVLVTGGTGVVGQAAVTELLRQGHAVRVLSRNADEVCEQWPEGVEAWPAAVTEQAELRGCAEGCDVVLHVAGIIEESPPENTYETVNVEGTRAIVREAERCKVGRFIYLSSLGADAGTSPYHRSKRRAEEIVRGFAGGWIILRPGNVYGPGDEVISLTLTMVRTLPVIPVIGGGDHEFQPIWVEDLAQAIGEAVRRTDLHGRVLELAGEERTSLNAILDHLSEITGRSPTRVPIPTFLASAGANMAGMLGVKVPLTESQVTMLSEGNWIRTPGTNALTGVFHIKPTPLDSGLRKLADSQPEQTPEKGVGSFKRRRYWIDISGSTLSAEELFSRFRERFSEVVPITMDLNAEPDTPKVLEKGSTITMGLPLRGNIQVRVEELTAKEAVLVTVAGHPMAGAVRFLSEQIGDALRFQVQLYDRPANLADWFLMRTVGETVQSRSWESMLESLIAESGGSCPGGIQHEEELLDADKAERVEGWLRDLILARKREHYAATTEPSPATTSAKRRRAESTQAEDAVIQGP
ncbi:MAG TPA: NAD-dependent epimerase/dehydratase family protein [Gemmatimonadaceae bacterium]|nr:NAD-dependent epimerase/dehydratase family protein [Gemmatimonadaceae bacterium]